MSEYTFKSQQMLGDAICDTNGFCYMAEVLGYDCNEAESFSSCLRCRARFATEVQQQIEQDVYSYLAEYRIDGKNIFEAVKEIKRLTARTEELEHRIDMLYARICELKEERERLLREPLLKQAQEANARGFNVALAAVEDAIERIKEGDW